MGIFPSKGQASADLLLPLIVLFMFAIIGLIMFKVFGGINTQIQASTDFDSGSKATLQNAYNKYPSWLDNLFVFLVGMFWIALIVTSFYLDTHPIFFIITLLLLIGIFVVASIVANAYNDIASASDFTSEVAQLPMITWSFNHLLQIMIAMGGSVLVALYAKQ